MDTKQQKRTGKNNRTGLEKYFKIIAVACLLVIGTTGKTQTLGDTIYTEIAAINKVFDSAFFLTFDVTMDYYSDTLYAGTDSADFNISNITGTYTFNQNKALYKLGNIEYMKNDSFTIAVYSDEKFILVGKPAPGATGGFLPTRAIMDSVLLHMQQNYTYSMTDYDSVKQIAFVDTYNMSASGFERIEIEYEPGSHQLTKIKLRLREEGNYNEQTEQTSFRIADLTFLFQNYRVTQVSESVFSEEKYLFFDSPTIMKPSDAYKDFTIYKSY